MCAVNPCSWALQTLLGHHLSPQRRYKGKKIVDEVTIDFPDGASVASEYFRWRSDNKLLVDATEEEIAALVKQATSKPRRLTMAQHTDSVPHSFGKNLALKT